MSVFEAECPLCKGSLWIDPATMKVVDHKPIAGERQKKADLGQFLKDSKKDKGWDDKMRKAQDEEMRRKAEIEAKFKQAKEGGITVDDFLSASGPKSAMDWD